jgi:trans-aconitate 2-methyltransferase
MAEWIIGVDDQSLEQKGHPMTRHVRYLLGLLLCLAVLQACATCPDGTPTRMLSGPRSSAEWDPGEYEKNSSVQYRAAHLVLKSITLKGTETVLDVGSGNGKISAEISKMVPNGSVIGVDIDPENVKFAKAKYPKDQYPNLDFQVQDAQNLPFDKQFDVVVSFSTLHWVPDLNKALGEIQKALKPGGTFATTVVRDFYTPLEEATNQMIQSPKWKKYFVSFAADYNFVQRDRYLKLLAQNGLTPVDVSDMTIYALFAGRVSFVPWLNQFYDYTRAIPAGLKDQFLNDVVDLYLVKQPIDAAGNIFYISLRVQAIATKPLR